jgi:hypothetical protein
MKSLVCLLLLALPMAPAVQSPEGLSFNATLDSIKIVARPGQVVTRQFRLTLDANQPRTHFRAHVDDWWRSVDGKQSYYAKPGTLVHSCARWVSLNPVDSAVEPGETLVVRITVAVPVEVPAGGFWCALTVDEVPDPLSAPQGVGVRFVASVSTGIFIYFDPVARLASISDVSLAPDEARITVHNDGNAPLGIEGRVEFFAPGATTPTATSDVARTTVLTEPYLDGILTAALPSPAVLPSGRYRVRAILDFGGDHYIGAEREVEIVRAVQDHGPIR